MSTNKPGLYREAFRETVSPAVIADTDLVITDVNEAAREFTGYSREELIGSTPRCLVNDDDVYAEIEETVLGGDAWVGEFESTAKDGQVVYGRGSIAPLTFDGEVHGYVAVFTDMTSHRRYEESLRILNRVLRHNLRNDANVVLGHIERVADEVVDRIESPEATDLLDSLDTAADRVDDMLDRARTTRRFSGVLAGEHGTLRPTDLSAAVEEAVGDAPTANVVVEDEVSGPTPVLADEMLSAALYAVIENAVEHNDKSQPELTLTTTEHPDQVVLSIADNGPGIHPSRHDEIFGNGEHTQVEHGEGLSLFFVDRLMEMYGGEVSVRPNEPEGAVFDLHFRRPGADPTVPPREFPTDPGGGSGGTADRSADGGATRVEETEPPEDGGAASGPAVGAAGDDPDGADDPPDGVRPPTDDVRSNRAGTRSRVDPGADRSAARPADPDAADGGPGSPAGGTEVGDAAARDDPAAAAAADAVGESVTPARLRGEVRGYPAVLDALPEYDRPHHLLPLRPAEPIAGGDPRLRGTAAAAFTDTAVVVVAAGDEGGRLSVPYDSLIAAGRGDDAVVLDAGDASYRLLLPRAHGNDDAVEAAVSFLERELR
ncbi:sensor histidine kinase [Halobaculum sp. EA56]|uniref:sensor histidine kinase n=1 Tax=Halobaculum sp. EA56 TaxID=3421648 RepID=UPI003EB756F2